MKDLENILSKFRLQGNVASIKPFGSGHINDTYKITNGSGHAPDYLLQRINHHVFRDVAGMMNNVFEVTEYAKKKLKRLGYQDINERILSLIQTTGGENFSRDGDQYWRVFEFIDLKSYDLAENTDQVYEGAKAFGMFLYLLDGFPIDKLVITIPNFHNLYFRLEQLNQAVEQLKVSKTKTALSEIREELSLVKKHADSLCEIQRLTDRRILPLRAVHHDTKFNNVLLNKQNKAKCVIDLDTVMPGVMHSDFGDGIRTGAATADEDELDLDKVDLDVEKYTAFTTGYLESAGEILTVVEAKHLVESTLLFPFMQGVRFLSDHIMGDVYYKVKYPGHNLHRARNQFHLFKQVNKRRKDLQSVIDFNISFSI